MGSPFFVAAGRADCYTRGEQLVLGKKGADMKGHCRGQQGAILVLTAFLLPFIIAFTGLAVDLGNLYVQHQRLQNAADAAVLAGAKAYAENNEKVDSHPKADERAREYIIGQYHNLAADENINPPEYKAKEYNKKVYYRVDLSEEFPLYFLSFIKKTQIISVSSIASIETSKQEENVGFFNNLFLYSRQLILKDSIDNHDIIDNKGDAYWNHSKNMISESFDGRIGYTTSYQPWTEYSSASSLYKVFTSQAKEENKTRNISDFAEPTTDGKAIFNKDGTLKSGYWSQVEHYDYDYETFLKYMRNLAKTAVYATDQNINTSNKSLFSNKVVAVNTNTIPNININIDDPLEVTDDPIYLYISPDRTVVVNINVNTDMNRPIIICVDGNPRNMSTQVHFNFNNHVFKGAIYAPYVNKDEGVLINASNSKFYGSIVANKIDIRGKNTNYYCKDYTKTNSSSGGGSSSDMSNSSIRLVASPKEIKWE